MSLIWQLGWFFRANWQRYLLTVTILCLIAVVQTKVPALIGGMIDTVVHAPANASIWPQFQPQLLTLLAIGLLVYILRYVWRVALYGAAYKLGYLLRQRLYQHYLAMDQHFYQSHRTGELMAHVSNDIQAVEMTAGEGILTLVDSVFMGCLVLGIMITQYSLPLTIISLLPLPITNDTDGVFSASLPSSVTFKETLSLSDMSEAFTCTKKSLKLFSAFPPLRNSAFMIPPVLPTEKLSIIISESVAKFFLTIIRLLFSKKLVL